MSESPGLLVADGHLTLPMGCLPVHDKIGGVSRVLLTVSVCSASWGFTLGSMQGDISLQHPLCSIHNQFALNKDMCNLHEKSLQRDRVS